MKSKKTWILLADGSRARVYLNEGIGKGLKPVPGARFDGSNLPTREINADKPGMTFNSAGAGGGRRKQPNTDPHRQGKLDFARQLAEFLEQGRKSKSFDRLVVVAAPKTLGDLRTVMPSAISQLVDGELAKDLMHLDERELPEHLGDLLAC